LATTVSVWNAPNIVKAAVALKLKTDLVTEPLTSQPLREVMDRVIAETPEVSGLEIGTGAYALLISGSTAVDLPQPLSRSSRWCGSVVWWWLGR
jgi:hypothetical protein